MFPSFVFAFSDFLALWVGCQEGYQALEAFGDQGLQ